ncbi:carbohydrate binding protein with CBM6 domain [Collimonas sp. PA-H2]|uniref:carbohydrate-binding protein n=1 Tax=Collimonas sp. PA-H2 TaxID=1881062 RepID=UPI000BF258CC|nr:carbohydrate-binding protein [Collimonas sp. PA-H2]PFH12383.1 carbohydrate binding protein with CBM6 domain [Collimonas sp. PA-H2]
METTVIRYLVKSVTPVLIGMCLLSSCSDGGTSGSTSASASSKLAANAGAPYGGTPWAVPGTIQAENFDTGGQNVGYYNQGNNNQGGQYRKTEGVGIEATSDTGTGYDVGWTTAGEWLNYTVNVAAAGNYTVQVRVASQGQGGTFHFNVDGVSATPELTVPDTKGWQNWQTLSTNMTLSAGQHVIQLHLDSAVNGGLVGNFNWFSIGSASTSTGPVAVPKTGTKKVYVHMMPWFETNSSSGNGAWGQHWTMANQNPNIVDANGKRQIASYYYPQTGPYASGDPYIIEYQLLLMKYAGVDGVLIDWPGSQNVWDYPKNRQNAEAIVAQTAKMGLSFAMVYEDHNVGMAYDAGLIPNKIDAAKQDMAYLKNNYTTKSNYIQLNGAPLVMDFGPQTFLNGSDWNAILSAFSTPPTFLSLWYTIDKVGANGKGEFPWIFSDGMAGLDSFYNNRSLNIKFGVAYPGFNTFYSAGGWSGPAWTLPYGATFSTTLNKAIAAADVNNIQIATWNDYGEGTMIEPTQQFGYSFLTAMQQAFGVSSSQSELQLIYTLYQKRVKYSGNTGMEQKLDQAAGYLAAHQVSSAAAIINSI